MAVLDKIFGTPPNIEAPLYSVKVNGAPLEALYSVSSIMVNKCINKIPYAKLDILDGDVAKQEFSASNSGLFAPGSKVEISTGQGPTAVIIFKGIIIKHTIKYGANNLLSLDLKDESVKLTIVRKNKIFSKKSDSTIIRDILSAAKVAIKEVGLTSLIHEEMVQYFCSDWDFILSRAEANGMVVIADHEGIRVIEPTPSETDSIDVSFGSDVYEFEAETDARDDFGSITASSWDNKSRDALSKEVSGTSGSSLSAVNPLFKKFDLQHPGQRKNEELEAWAKAKKAKSKLANIKGRVKTDGNNTVKPGHKIKLSGFSSQFNDSAFISSVSHHISASTSYYTEIEFGYAQEWFTRKYHDIAELPASGLLPPVHGLQPGIVSAITGDPENNYRIKVTLPLVGQGNDGVWARFATLDAGNKRGSFFLPEIGDEVVLGFMNDDPREPVILGMFFSSNENGTPPIEPTEENYKKGFYTKSKIHVEFDDEKQSVQILTPEGNEISLVDKDDSKITIKDKSGNSIEMTEDGITITSAKDFKIKASGKISLEGDKSIALKSKEKLTVDGGGGATVNSSSGMIEIKGQLVKIN